MGPVPASKMALERAGLTVNDIDLIESNEAFAAQARSIQGIGLLSEIVNPMAGRRLGHPVGATGAIIMTKLIYELHRTGVDTAWQPCVLAAARHCCDRGHKAVTVSNLADSQPNPEAHL